MGQEDGPGRKEEVTRYGSLAATGNFLALDRVDVQYAVKEIARKMSNPEAADWEKLKRLALYLKGRPRAVVEFDFVAAEEYDALLEELDVFTDSDWAGCRRTRRSTTGGVATWAGMLVKSWSTTQALIALSSGEAELYAMVKASAEGLGLQSLLNDIGYKVRVRVKADASAALGVVERKGLGRLRHVHTNFLWVQSRAADKSIKFEKEKGCDNPADSLTKNVPRELLEKICQRLRVDLRSDVNEEGFKLAALERISEDVSKHGMSLEPWIRMDLQSQCLRGTRPGGPATGSIAQRRTYRQQDGELLCVDACEEAKGGFKSYWSHRSVSHPIDTVTVLLYETLGV